MEWYQRKSGRKRLEAESKQMREHTAFLLFQTEGEELEWCGGLRSGRLGYWHREVRLVYDSNHPYKRMTVFILEPKLPQLNNHIYPNGTICYESGNWSADWTAFSVYLTVIHFLDDFYSGRMH